MDISKLFSLNKNVADGLSNHPNASLFETVEAYISKAMHVIAEPGLYVK
jgi:hypothetical protein